MDAEQAERSLHSYPRPNVPEATWHIEDLNSRRQLCAKEAATQDQAVELERGARLCIVNRLRHVSPSGQRVVPKLVAEQANQQERKSPEEFLYLLALLILWREERRILLRVEYGIATFLVNGF